MACCPNDILMPSELNNMRQPHVNIFAPLKTYQALDKNEGLFIKGLKLVTIVLIFACVSCIIIYFYEFYKDHITKKSKEMRKWSKKKINEVINKLEEKQEKPEGYNTLKAMQIVDGEAHIFYIADKEKLIVQIMNLINKNSVILIDFNVTITLLKLGKVVKTIDGPKVNIISVIQYNKEFMFDVPFFDLPATQVIIEVVGQLGGKKVVAARMLLHPSNMDIIHSSIERVPKIEIKRKKTLAEDEATMLGQDDSFDIEIKSVSIN